MIRKITFCFIYFIFLYSKYVEATSSWEYNPDTQYNIYYDKSKNSIYNKLYDNKYIPYDEYLINRLISEVAENKDNISIMDFGSGNGRHFQIYQKVATKLQAKNKFLTLIAYDPSLAAFNEYKNILIEQNFNVTTQNSNSSEYFQINTLEKDNFKVILIKPNGTESISHLAKTIGNIDITICLFGVLSHIQHEAKRVETIQTLNNITNHTLFIGFPSYKVLVKERQAFDLIRDSKFNMQINHKNLSLEKGDLIYARNYNNMHVENFFHVYENTDEIKHELLLAGIKQPSIGVNKILHETTLTQHPILGYVDYILSKFITKFLPENVVNYSAEYFAVEIKK